MIRLLVFFVLLLVAAFGFGWLADRPGDVVLTWQGQTFELSLMTALAGIFAIGIIMIIGWGVLRVVLRLPSIVAMSGRARRRSKGFSAVSRGMVAVGAGDARAAQRSAVEARRLLGEEPMTLLLTAQAAQISGDRPGAEAAFSRMLDSDETRVLGLRGLFLEAKRRGDAAASRFYADEAFKLAPGVSWVGDAALDYKVRDEDWTGAIAVIDQSVSRRLIDKPAARRQRAVLLAAAALQERADSPDRALEKAQAALKLEPGLVPAAVLAARRLIERTEIGKAAKIVEAAWKRGPHPDLADVYLDIRPGDSALDRLTRARALGRLAPRDPESQLVIARAALDAREFAVAREALQSLMPENATVRSCLLMAELEERSGGSTGLVREWVARASRAAPDRAWVADGIVQDIWTPYSPLTGVIDAFAWREPPQNPAALAGRGFEMPVLDHIEPEPVMPDLPAIDAPPMAVEPPPAVIIEPQPPLADRRPAAVMKPPAASAGPAPDPAQHAPDDPGPDGPLDESVEKKPYRLFS